MALAKSIKKEIYGNEMNFNNAYHRIAHLTGDKNIITCTLEILDETKKYKLNEETFSFVPSITDDSKNFIKQGYEYLKTLDEYKDAIDLLDEGQTS